MIEKHTILEDSIALYDSGDECFRVARLDAEMGPIEFWWELRKRGIKLDVSGRKEVIHDIFILLMVSTATASVMLVVTLYVL